MIMIPSLPSKPHFNQELIEGLLRSSYHRQGQPTLTTDCIDFIDEDNSRAAFFASSNKERTRLAPTPTNISTKSEPEI